MSILIQFIAQSRRVALLLVISPLAQCSQVKSETLAPSEKNDNAAALQSAIDKAAAKGGGLVQLEEGIYKISKPILMRSGVELAGRGSRTIITNEGMNNSSTWAGVTIFAGNLSPGSFVYNGGTGYVGAPLRVLSGMHAQLMDCSRQLPKPGTVVWLASEKGKVGAGGFLRPEHGEITKVATSGDCSVTFADPTRIPASVPTRLYWADGSVATFEGLEANAPIADAQLHDVQLRSTASQALLSSGCYNCTFNNIEIGRSRRFAMMQAMRHSTVSNFTGSFTERGIEITMFAQDNVMKGMTGRFKPQGWNGARPMIRFGEFARHNSLSHISLDLGEAFKGSMLIRFDESSNNTLANIEFFANEPNTAMLYATKDLTTQRARPKLLPPGTTMHNIKVCRRNGGNSTATCEQVN